MMKQKLKLLNILCYHDQMRQKFDVGDLVQVSYPDKISNRGIVMETMPINKNIEYPDNTSWHTDEYTCKIQFLSSSEIRWVRAKWLRHLSKIN